MRKQWDVCDVYADMFCRAAVRWDGSHRAGMTPFAHLLRRRMALPDVDFPFPKRTHSRRLSEPSFVDVHHERTWKEFVVLLTFADNTYKDGWSKGVNERDGRDDGATVRTWERFVRTCDIEMLWCVFDDLRVNWRSQMAENLDVEKSVYFGLLSLLRNPAANLEMYDLLFEYPDIESWTFVDVVRLGSPPYEVWERILFDYRLDVTSVDGCPEHLADVYRTAN